MTFLFDFLVLFFCAVSRFLIHKVSQSNLTDHTALWRNCSFVPRQGSVPILLPNSQRTLHQERLTNVIGICRLTRCQNYNRSSCFSKGGTVDIVKLGRHQLERHFEITVPPITLVVSDSCGADTQISMKPASLWSEACGPTTCRRTSTPSIKTCREMSSCFSKVKQMNLKVISHMLLHGNKKRSLH